MRLSRLSLLFASPCVSIMPADSIQDKSSAQSAPHGRKQRWFPLESNPALMNAYIEKLGFDTALYEFTDVFSTESWALQMIAQPVAAVIMLYPLTDKQESYRSQDQIATDDVSTWFIKQRIGNACGTIGLLHALMNVPEGLKEMSVLPDSWLHQFQRHCPAAMDPILKAQLLEADDTVATLHDQATSDATHNQTPRGNIDDKIITHFIAFVCSRESNQLLELDGRKDGPVVHGSTTPNTLLQDSCRVVETFMQRDPDEMRFTILALAPKMQ